MSNDSAGALVAGWRDAIHGHPALAALRAYNARLGAGPGPVAARALMASLYAFNRGTPAGIAQLAGRWADHLAERDPFGAHAVAAIVLASAVDEFGLAGTRPHLELFRAFGERWDVSPAAILDAANAVPAARDLGERVSAWYRTAPLTVGLTVHFVSEETSAEEFAGWYPLFPDAEYTRVHAELEPGHSHDAGQALARHLESHPEERASAEAAIEPYLARYGAMFAELAATLQC